MRLHWGHGIAIFLTVFVITLVIVLVSSMRMDHQLVAEDYYAEDLAYQSRYIKEADQRSSDNLVVDYTSTKGVITLQFDTIAQNISGQAHFYRPSDANLDMTIEITDPLQKVDASQLRPGKWMLKVDWQQDGKKYYKEQIIIL